MSNELQYTIKTPHRDVKVLYCDTGNHDKLYIVATLVYAHDPADCDVIAFYKSRKATKWNKTLIHKCIAYNISHVAVNSVLRKKLAKGYRQVAQDPDLLKIGVKPIAQLAKSLLEDANLWAEGAGEATVETPTTRWVYGDDVEVPFAEYECVDDFGVKGLFSVGCVYRGRPCLSDRSKIEVEDDMGNVRAIDRELFREAGV